MKTAEQIAERLWEKCSSYSGHYGCRIVAREQFDAALHEYGAAVRQRAAVVCKRQVFDADGELCAAAILRMELP